MTVFEFGLPKHIVPSSINEHGQLVALLLLELVKRMSNFIHTLYIAFVLVFDENLLYKNYKNFSFNYIFF